MQDIPEKVGRIHESGTDDFGQDAQTSECGDMIAMGIVDPVKLVRTVLQTAASVTGLLLTTEATIADLPREDGTGVSTPSIGGLM
ncbi:hypothetical protein A7J57_00415 [Agrobacterium tumefaciens]|uniref:Chaperonin GroEL n=1 Tax=Agrobacterium tumefaciens TaxID=358 RepID=A0A176XHD2_AGRTU|nr:hypothetical protein A7J57_00415 [Agrobacterium tumefaciens]